MATQPLHRTASLLLACLVFLGAWGMLAQAQTQQCYGVVLDGTSQEFQIHPTRCGGPDFPDSELAQGSWEDAINATGWYDAIDIIYTGKWESGRRRVGGGL